jgi:deoxyribodipyrimidine photo-lyase
MRKLTMIICFHCLTFTIHYSFNIVPVWETSDKQEAAAFIVRSKILPKLSEFLTEFPPVTRHPVRGTVLAQPIDWEAAIKSVKVDQSVGEVTSFRPGYKAAVAMLDSFIKERLRFYKKLRNDPVEQHKAVSNLSPYFHFGQISAHRAILEVNKEEGRFKDDVDHFFNETVIWKEMADNLCYYNSDYDNLNGAKEWARTSLREHLKDKREYIYTLQQFEEAKTHDNMWNAAQNEMKVTGKMSGYMRMYWAKKILEWTKTPEEAIKIAIYLNDRWSLDGRDPSGYLGIMWSIAGVNDRAFGDRKVSGKIRFMSYNACFQKFDGKAYISKFLGGSVFKKHN